jgi:F-type H+-transporting ATPase subunit alpha
MQFDGLLKETKEIGFIEEVQHSLVRVSGLPSVTPDEIVIFESGGVGRVVSLGRDNVEVLLLSSKIERVGTRVARSGDQFSVKINKSMLGLRVDGLGIPISGSMTGKDLQKRYVDVEPASITERSPVNEPFVTGVTIVDMVVPLGRGQRELVIGDRKTGKTSFIMKAIVTQARAGTVCVYAAIGKKQIDIEDAAASFAKLGVANSTVLVASSSSEASGKIFLTPYTAMTIAEYFRDAGYHVCLVLDDMTTHAKYYREISLLANRFPGRNSYPGDIFYVHSRLMERAGNFKKTSITCLPMAESVQGDLSGYIQTNIMSMTDGHIFFDAELFAEGKRPAISPFLSVSRVGRQAHSSLVREMSTELSRFLTRQRRLREFMQFGAELNEQIKQDLALGDRVQAFFFQPEIVPVPMNVNVLIMAGLWAGLWKGMSMDQMKQQMNSVNSRYTADKRIRAYIDQAVLTSKSFAELVNVLKQNEGRIGDFQLEYK